MARVFGTLDMSVSEAARSRTAANLIHYINGCKRRLQCMASTIAPETDKNACHLPQHSGANIV